MFLSVVFQSWGICIYYAQLIMTAVYLFGSLKESFEILDSMLLNRCNPGQPNPKL